MPGYASLTSMRPERKAPENFFPININSGGIRAGWHFNEAGAKSPGEAIYTVMAGERRHYARTSMRPERKAPENTLPCRL